MENSPASDHATPLGKVIVTYGRSVMSLTIAHSLAERGVEVVGCDSIGMTLLTFSKYAADNFITPDWKEEPEEFLEAFEKELIARKPTDGRPYVLMPCHAETAFFAKHRERLEQHIQLACPTTEMLTAIEPKSHFAKTVEKENIKAPQTWILDSRETVRRLSEELEFPKLIKPDVATGGRGISKLNSGDELLEKYEELTKEFAEAPLLQEFTEGEDYCFAGLFEKGELKASMAYHNVYNFPADSGAGIMRETVDDTPFREIACKLMQPLGWNGVAEIDFLWNGDPEETGSVIEVNARFWGGLFQSVESGVDFPWLLYRLTVDGTVPAAESAVIGTKTKVPFLWLNSALRELDVDHIDLKAEFKKAADEDTFWEGVKYFASSLKDSVSKSGSIAQLKEILEQGNEAKNEPFYKDDPKAVLGLLFVISSLKERGELPEEVKF